MLLFCRQSSQISTNSNEISPTDDPEHEWIVRTCRKAWDEVGADPETLAAATNPSF